MTKLANVIASLAVAAGMLLPTPATAHKAPKYCGHKKQMGAGWYKLYGHETSCYVAKKVARRWENKCVWRNGCGRDGSTRIDVGSGFDCKVVKKVGIESVKVRCVASRGRIVHFFWGS